MDVSPELRKSVDLAFLQQLASDLKSAKISPLRARLLAKEFLPISKSVTVDLLKLGLADFCKKNPSFNSIQLIVEKHTDDSETNDLLQRMRQHMQDGNIDAAIQVAEQK